MIFYISTGSDLLHVCKSFLHNIVGRSSLLEVHNKHLLEIEQEVDTYVVIKSTHFQEVKKKVANNISVFTDRERFEPTIKFVLSWIVRISCIRSSFRVRKLALVLQYLVQYSYRKNCIVFCQLILNLLWNYT